MTVTQKVHTKLKPLKCRILFKHDYCVKCPNGVKMGWFHSISIYLKATIIDGYKF